MEPGSPPLGPSSLSRFSSPSIIPDSHTAAMLVLVNKPETHSYPVFHVQKDPPPDVQDKDIDGNIITAYDQILIGSDIESDLRMFFAEPRHCSLIVDHLGKIYILNFSTNNPCQLNNAPLSPCALHPLRDQDVVHVAGKDFRVEYKPGYPICAPETSQEKLSSGEEEVQLPPSSPKIMNHSPQRAEFVPYSPPVMVEQPSPLPNSAENKSPDSSIVEAEQDTEDPPASLHSSPRVEEQVSETSEPPSKPLDTSPMPSPKRPGSAHDTADHSSASMECNTSQPSLFVKDLSAMDESVEAPEKRRRISDFPKKSISSPIKLKRRSAPVDRSRRSLRLPDQTMDVSTDSPVRRRSPRIQNQHAGDVTLSPAVPSNSSRKSVIKSKSTPVKTPKKSPKRLDETPRSVRGSNSPLATTSQKSVRFGPTLSPEEFDRHLPAITPIKRGATPRSATRDVMRRSTPYKVPVPLSAKLDPRQRRSNSLSPKRTPANPSPVHERKSPKFGKRFSPVKSFSVRLVPPAKGPRLLQKGLGKGVLTEMAESRTLKSTSRLSTPTSLKAKPSRIPKPLQAGLGSKQLLAVTHTLTKGARVTRRNSKSPEKSLKIILEQKPQEESTKLVTQQNTPEPSNTLGAEESSESPQNKSPKLARRSKSAVTQEVKPSAPSPPTRKSTSPNFNSPSQKSPDSSPEFQTPPSTNSSQVVDKLTSPKSGLKTQNKSTPSPKSSRSQKKSPKILSPQTPVSRPRNSPARVSVDPKKIEDSRTSRSSSRVSTDTFFSPSNPKQNVTPKVSTKSPNLRTPKSPAKPGPPINTKVGPIAKNPTGRAKSPRMSIPLSPPVVRESPNVRSKSPRVSDIPRSPRVGFTSPIPDSLDSSLVESKSQKNLRSKSPSIKSKSPIMSPSEASNSPTLRSKSSQVSDTPISPHIEYKPRRSPSVRSPLAISTSPNSVVHSFSPSSPDTISVQETPRSTPQTPRSTPQTPRSRPQTPRSRPQTPTSRLRASRSSIMSPIHSVHSPSPGRKSPSIPDPPSPGFSQRSPRLELLPSQTRPLTPQPLTSPQYVGTPRPNKSLLRNEDAFVPRLFKTPKGRNRTSQPEAHFRPSLFNISESPSPYSSPSETPRRGKKRSLSAPGVESPPGNTNVSDSSPSSKESRSKRSQSLPGNAVKPSVAPRQKNTALPEESFNPYLFRSPKSKSIRTPPKPSEDNFNPYLFRSPRSKSILTPQNPSEDNFDPEIFRTPPTPSFSGRRGTKRVSAKQGAKSPKKVSKSEDTAPVDVSPLLIRETKRMKREKQPANSRATKRLSDSKSSPRKILILDSPAVSPVAVRRRTRGKTTSMVLPVPTEALTSFRVLRGRKGSSLVVADKRTRGRTTSVALPIPPETLCSPIPVRVTRQKKPTAVEVGNELNIVSPVPTKRSLRSRKPVLSHKQAKSILKSPSKRQKFSEQTNIASPSIKIIGRYKTLTRARNTRVSFASPASKTPEKPPPHRPPTPQKSTRRLRSQISPQSVRVTQSRRVK